MPWSCRRSGRKVFDDMVKQRIIGIDRERHFFARGRAPVRPARAPCQNRLCRGDGGKNTKPTMSARSSSATSSASGVERPQIFTMSDMASGRILRLACERAPPFYIPSRTLSCKRMAPLSHRWLEPKPLLRLTGFQAICGFGRRAFKSPDLFPQFMQLTLETSGGTPPFALPNPRRQTADHNAADQGREDQARRARSWPNTPAAKDRTDRRKPGRFAGSPPQTR